MLTAQAQDRAMSDCQSMDRSTTLVQTEISQQPMDRFPYLAQTFMMPQMMSHKDFDDPLIFLLVPP